MPSKPKKPRKGPRNPLVIPSRQRKAGPHKDKRVKGGNKNEQRELMEEFLLDGWMKTGIISCRDFPRKDECMGPDDCPIFI